MNGESIINVHDIIRKYPLPISRKNQSIRDCLRSCYKGFYLGLKETVTKDYPDDFPPNFYNDLLNKNLSIINHECKVILKILELDNPNLCTEEFNTLMCYLCDNDAFRFNKFEEGDLMARIRPGKGPYERKDIFHIPFTRRECASSQRFSIPKNPCLYLSAYKGFNLHNYEMVKAAWIECNMPTRFTYCIYELQKEIRVLHFGKSGSDYLSKYDYEKDEDKKKEHLRAITQYLLSFPIRAACHISVEKESTQDGEVSHEEYFFPQLLMRWLQKSSKVDGVGYLGASSKLAQRDLYINNIALPAKDISAENEYDPYLKKCFKLSSPRVKDLSKDFKSDQLVKKIEGIKGYWEKLEQIMSTQVAPSSHPYIVFLSYCRSLYDMYINRAEENISDFYEKFVSLYKKIKKCQLEREWVDQYNDGKLLTKIDFDDILMPVYDLVISVCWEINRILCLHDCGTFLNEMNFQNI